MNRSHFAFALLASIAGLTFSAASASPLVNETAPPTQVAPVQSADAALELSAQRRVVPGRQGGARVGRVGNVGRVGRVGGNVGRVGRVGGNVGRVGRIGRVGRVEGRIGRVGRVGYRYGRVGRIGYIPVPVPIGPGPGVPMGPGPRVVGPTCAVCPVQACQIAVYSEPNLTGQAFETADNQPRLDQNRWQNQITSVIVKGGTWDFFPDLEYRGGPPVLRLAPGSYPALEPQWVKRIGSFMCVR
jgi:Beta/Gamma crystallin